jgi:futalosine hydrolase
MNLILFPTALEHDICWPKVQPHLDAEQVVAAVCGFGLVGAGVETARLIAKHQPSQILLLGIAGGYRADDVETGVFQFTHVACDGIGVGEGASFRSASEMGWQQCPDNGSDPEIGDQISLAVISPTETAAESRLLSVTSASADANHAAQRRQRHPSAIAEDMEGFAVAMAATRARVPVAIIRGISNLAGDRNHANWKIERALELAAELAIEHLQRVSS